MRLLRFIPRISNVKNNLDIKNKIILKRANIINCPKLESILARPKYSMVCKPKLEINGTWSR